ncbi:MAG: hypothetical protein HC936_17490 [Leptolyngbyaceae cyanobacterium SU_3_3]|nr:hypothetical protein [Leptolyngbyaceae cyanobacterium SU_3_3]NJR52711.1 hypothetical protein [Leptolyngbyaceae cyanobacterium CSU_1_3]
MRVRLLGEKCVRRSFKKRCGCLVRYLSAAAGVDPIKEFRVMIVLPPQMVVNVRIGAMQGDRTAFG